MTSDTLYQEALRPQFHFTAKKHWINDPNGLVYSDGEYHLYFQHTPGSMVHGRTTWGHAVSADLVHWKQLHTAALDVDDTGWMWSGSAAVDHHDTGGFQDGDTPPLIAFYTAGGERVFPDRRCIQCIAHSNDRGRTWTKYAGNPVIGHIRAENRDPKVVWHEPTARWIMTLFMDGNDYALFTSPDLKSWTHLQDLTLPGVSECPDFFELPVDGDPSNTRWVFWGASGGYLLGRFDGHSFTPETDVLQAEQGANGYAAQTWSDIPAEDGRRIQISWMRGGLYPAMPFNQQMSFPVELTLRTLPDGIRLCREPVREIELLHTGTRTWPAGDLAEMEAEQFQKRYASGEISSYAVTDLREAESRLVLADESDLFDVRMAIEVDGRGNPDGDDELGDGNGSAVARGFTIEVQGHTVEYDAEAQTLSCLGKTAALRTIDGRVSLHLLIDRTSLELFGNQGEVSMSFCFLPAAANHRLALNAAGGGVHGGVRIVSLVVHELRSAWENS
ncbi:MAG: glycoside hydrolase family 32 protein [Gemmatimonadetes bacterium]|nr:glycoside hydrolase family 32 protein [Gemmatimonadota bacterium]MYG15342.1 glycoside hydrolase family 32 protein [Gemmatimonadota bacterium]